MNIEVSLVLYLNLNLFIKINYLTIFFNGNPICYERISVQIKTTHVIFCRERMTIEFGFSTKINK